MKAIHLKFLVLFMIVLMSCSSATQRSVDKLTSYVEKIELESPKYSLEDWKTTQLEFERLVDNIEANYENMTPEEREAALKAIGRYYGLVAKQGLETAAQETQKLLDAIPAFIEGFTDVFE